LEGFCDFGECFIELILPSEGVLADEGEMGGRTLDRRCTFPAEKQKQCESGYLH
jgi:hypothetical protein